MIVDYFAVAVPIASTTHLARHLLLWGSGDECYNRYHDVRKSCRQAPARSPSKTAPRSAGFGTAFVGPRCKRPLTTTAFVTCKELVLHPGILTHAT